MILIWALTLVGSVVIGNSGNSNNGEETTEQHEARVRRELAEASAIQDRRIKKKTEIEYARTYHPRTVSWFKNEYPELVVDGKVRYDKLEWNQFKRYLGTKLKRKKRSGSSSNIHRKSLPRAAKNTTARKLTQIQVFLDEREHQESQQQVL